MKTFVLMYKVTAELFEGIRVSFFDRFSASDEINSLSVYTIKLIGRHDGFLVYRPDMSELSWYVNNRGIERHFEILGEL